MPPTPVPGSHVWLRQRRWRVDRTRVDGRTVRVDVSHRTGQLTVLTPYDKPRLIAPDRRAVRVRRQQGLARLAHLVGSARAVRLAHAAIEGRLQIWPHQLEPVLAVLDGQRRLLIADDVGLGKTIQAGLILAEVLRRHPVAHALVVTPASLQQQWAAELRHRFALDAWTTDSAFEDAMASGQRDANPWRRPGVWIVSIDYLKQPHVLDGLPPVAWDVVVVDEAHIATGRSDRHDTCDELGRRARHLVLLSATPHDGDPTRFSRLLRLGALPFAGDGLAIFRRTRADIVLPLHRVIRWTRVRATPDFARLLDALQAFERAVLQASRPSARDAALLLLSVFRKRALSTMAALDRSLSRRLEWIDSAGGADRPDWLQPTLDFGGDDVDDEDRISLTADVGLPRAKERAWLRRLRTLAAAARAGEPKVARIRAYAARTTDPFVLFTEFRHSLEDVQRVLGTVRSLAVIHGGQADVVRHREIARFLAGDASVLIATDVGSQGLNLQARARWLVNLELPWNPARLEQRIGRLDRIGQSRQVHATILVTDHPAEGTLLTSLARRTLTARRELGSTALADVAPPTHLAVAASLLQNTTLPPHAPMDATIQPCTRYRRRARAHAVVAVRRRQLRSLWRGGPAAGGRPIRTRLALAALPSDARIVLVVSGPVIDGTGELIERRLLALALPAHSDVSRLDRSLIDRCLHILAAHVRRRLRRLQPVVSAASARRLATERAIALHLYTIGHPREAQLGLFSQREAAAFRTARERSAFGATTTAGYLQMEEVRACLDTAEGAVEWIGERS
jgi:superfamily II DNA or RNA helicase